MPYPPQFHLGTVRTLRFSLNIPSWNSTNLEVLAQHLGDLNHQFHHWNGLNLEVLSKKKIKDSISGVHAILVERDFNEVQLAGQPTSPPYFLTSNECSSRSNLSFFLDAQ